MASVSLLMCVAGCASLQDQFPGSMFIAKEARLCKEHLKKGRTFERKGDLVSALKAYKLALTVNPENQPALESRKRVQKKLLRMAEDHYNAGLRFHKQGKYGRARHQFLIALRLRPDYPEVIDLLMARKRIKTKRFVVHTLKPGESLAKVSELYYGDYRKFPMIAKYNNITDATRVRTGQKIKVPEMEGIKFLVEEKQVKTEALETAETGSWDWDAYAMRLGKGRADASDKRKQVERGLVLREHAIELYRQKKYKQAIEFLETALRVDPEDHTALDYAYRSHYEWALLLLNRKDYLAARDQFKYSTHYKDDCRTCYAFIKTCENSYKEMHYNQGIQFFAREQLEEAIEQWQLVKALDPNYKRVNYLIDKAQKISNKIKELKKRKMEQQKEAVH